MTCSASSMLLPSKPILMRRRRISRGRQQIHNSANRSNESLIIWATTRLCDSKLVVTELPDQLLKENFPEEKMQMMAHLARECLQWDPDSRLTMSPSMSTRKSMPAAFFYGIFQNLVISLFLFSTSRTKVQSYLKLNVVNAHTILLFISPVSLQQVHTI
ncbi:receptor-like serine/threonine-protein kinase NCRK [Iris pallida]|uniref:Receptor-like serine/threonine-protein kinase NCRK n=1 Tax=Iris pallida TaxID=29817 RepID=A0AAX6IFC5_IRIPA|nr:receptor-like serine/threonine-protein kinase NCRK [Iris pallida]